MKSQGKQWQAINSHTKDYWPTFLENNTIPKQALSNNLIPNFTPSIK